jgi:hypothetical protein
MTTEIPINDEEIAIVRAAAEYMANTWPGPEWDERLHDLALRWRAALPTDLRQYASAGERLVKTYVQMYPSLEGSLSDRLHGCGIDAWGGSESKSVLTRLVLTFPTEEHRWDAVRRALDVAHFDMG